MWFLIRLLNLKGAKGSALSVGKSHARNPTQNPTPKVETDFLQRHIYGPSILVAQRLQGAATVGNGRLFYSAPQYFVVLGLFLRARASSPGG